ncbi:MAG TPA: metallophosphoesterase, partial [Vicinamibacterales bacterium]|nr:metallophosphoesterase [Vicinamibacterales bacterium]
MSRTRASLYNVPIASGLAAALAVFALTASRPAAQTDVSPCDITTSERVVAIGDVHGAFDNFVAILREAGLIGGNRRWSGGKAVLVQTGDVLDRGPDSKRVLDLLRNLEGDAARAGGQVHALVGNHEVMRLIGDLRYVSAKEYEAFQTPESSAVRNAQYASASTTKRDKARK